MNAATEPVRVIVEFTAKEVEVLDQAVEKLNQKPGERAKRSVVVRIGALKHATEILTADDAPKAPEGT